MRPLVERLRNLLNIGRAMQQQARR